MNPPPAGAQPVNNTQTIDQIDSFINGLSLDNSSTQVPAASSNKVAFVATPPATDDEMRKFVLKHSAELVENTVNSILELQKLTVASGDPRMMESLAAMIVASTGAIETVNKMHMLNKKVEAAKDLKTQEIEGKKEIQRIKNDGYLNLPAGQTNILMATREEIMNQLTGKAKTVMVTDVIDLSGS